MDITGACHCGEIRYTAKIDPAKVAICHCTDCQILSGTSFRTVVPTPEAEFRLTAGEPKIYVKTADSGNKREQAFCGTCGTPIYATSVGGTDRVLGLRVGSINQRDALAPKQQIFMRSALDWLHEIPELPGKQAV